MTDSSPSSAYFNPVTRMWEFLFGSLVFLILPLVKLNKKLSHILEVFAFSLLISVGFFMPRDISFPGFVALLPVISAVILIFTGSNAHNGLIKKMLSSKPMVYFGDLAFAIYLWHWPILVFYQHYTGSTDISIPSGIIIMVSSIAIAAFTSIIVEKPIKRINFRSSVFYYAFGFAFMVPILAITIYAREDIKSVQNKFIKNWQNASIAAFDEDNINLTPDGTHVSFVELVTAKVMLPRVYHSGL